MQFTFLILQVRYETPPRHHRTDSKTASKPLLEGQVKFHFKPSLASDDENIISVAFPRDVNLREASLKLRSLYNMGPDKCAVLVLGEEPFTEVPIIHFPKFTSLSMNLLKLCSLFRPFHSRFSEQTKKVSIKLFGRPFPLVAATSCLTT